MRLVYQAGLETKQKKAGQGPAVNTALLI